MFTPMEGKELTHARDIKRLLIRNMVDVTVYSDDDCPSKI
jgi:hypothetical protein